MKITPAQLKAGIEQANSDRAPYEQVWDWAHAFLTGQQDTVQDLNSRAALLGGTDQNERNKLVFNLLLPTYRGTLAKLDVSSPGITALPASTASAEIMRAEASGLLARYYWQRLRMRDVIREALEWAIIAGTAGLYTYWDPGINKLRVRPLAPHDIAWPKGLKRWADARWRAARLTVDAEDAKEAYPQFEWAIENARSNAPNSATSTTENPENSVELWDCYVRDGRRVILLGETALYDEVDGWNPEVCPISIIRYTPIPGRILGIGLIPPLVDPQASLNRIINAVVLNLDLGAHFKWLVNRDANIDESALRGEPGEIVLYDNVPDGKPTPITPQPIGQDAFSALQQIETIRQDIAGRHATSMGRVAKGITSARHTEAIVAKDDSQLQPTQAEIESACVGTARAMLVLSKRHMTEPQAVRMLDATTGTFVAETLAQTDLVDEPDVVIEAGSLFTEDAEDRRVQILELVAAGMMTPEEGLTEIAAGTSQRHILDRIRAMAHAGDMLNGVIAGEGYVDGQPSPFHLYETDDAVAFERKWREYMRSNAFYGLPKDAAQRVLNAYQQILALRRMQRGATPVAPAAALKNIQALNRGNPEQVQVSSNEPPPATGREPEPVGMAATGAAPAASGGAGG